ncbi:MAG: hypothetical protein M1814_002462 [Vezdaea aestivalis]|nr:MAG: hypothetical protein M1814_002462 [Vezdaea aestivalis]
MESSQKTADFEGKIESQLQSHQPHTQLLSPPHSKTPETTPLQQLAKLQRGVSHCRKRKVEPDSVVPQPCPKRVQTSEASGTSRAIVAWLSEIPLTTSEPDLQMASPVRKRSLSSMQPSNTASTTTTNGGPPTRSKSSFYRRKDYEFNLSLKGSYICESDQGLLTAERKFCDELRTSDFKVPSDSLFEDSRLRKTCEKLRNQNEARVIQDVALLVVPSAESLATCGNTHLKCLKETVDAQWDLSIAFHGPRPFPDYAVGFGYQAFSPEQQKKIGYYPCHKPNSLVKLDVCFPFLSRESKSVGQLNVADKQNAHSMTVAMKGLVDLFRSVGRQQDLHRKILAFSFSHDCQMVSINAHYPEIEGDETKYFRYTIGEFTFLGNGNQSQWISYKFTRAIYDKFVPGHIKRIKEVIDKIPDPSGVSFGTGALSVDDDNSSQRGSQSAVPSQGHGQMLPPSIPDPEASQLQRQFEQKEAELQSQLNQMKADHAEEWKNAEAEHKKERDKDREEAQKQMDVFVKQLEQQNRLLLEQEQRMKQLISLLHPNSSGGSEQT